MSIKKNYFAKVRRVGSSWKAEIWQEYWSDDAGCNIVHLMHSRNFLTKRFAHRWANRDLKKHVVNKDHYSIILGN